MGELGRGVATQTTYVFQFGDAVADVNEGNAATNLRHAFSTGSVLDTLPFEAGCWTP